MKEAEEWWLRFNNGVIVIDDDSDDDHEEDEDAERQGGDNVGAGENAGTVARGSGTAAAPVVAGDREEAVDTGTMTAELVDEKTADVVAPGAGAGAKRRRSPRSGSRNIDEEISGDNDVQLREGLQPRKRKATVNLQQVDGVEVQSDTTQSPSMSASDHSVSSASPTQSDDLTPREWQRHVRRPNQMPEGQWTITHVSKAGIPLLPKEAATKFRTACGVLSKKVNINIPTWTDVSNSQKDFLWGELQKKFEIPEASKEAVQAAALKFINKSWRKHKHDLMTKFVRKGLSPVQYYEGIITEADWSSFVEAKQSEEFQKVSQDHSKWRLGRFSTKPTGKRIFKNPRNKGVVQHMVRQLSGHSQGCPSANQEGDMLTKILGNKEHGGSVDATWKGFPQDVGSDRSKMRNNEEREEGMIEEVRAEFNEQILSLKEKVQRLTQSQLAPGIQSIRESVEHDRYPIDNIKEVSLNFTKNKQSVSSSEKAEKYPFWMGLPFGNRPFIESLTKPCLTLHSWYRKRTNEEIHHEQSIVADYKEKHFLHGDSYFVINFDDLYCLFHFDALDTSLLRCWTLYMMEEAENIGASVGFLDPGSITDDEIQREIEDVVEYIFKVMVHNRDKHFLLGAYNFLYHWILIVIDLKKSTVAYMDSKSKPSNELDPTRNCINRAFEMYAELEGQSYGKTRLSHHFHFPCHTQPDGNNHCGLYVSHHMQQFVTSMPPNLEKFNTPRNELRRADFVSIRGRLCNFIYREIISEDGQFHSQDAH